MSAYPEDRRLPERSQAENRLRLNEGFPDRIQAHTAALSAKGIQKRKHMKRVRKTQVVWQPKNPINHLCEPFRKEAYRPMVY